MLTSSNYGINLNLTKIEESSRFYSSFSTWSEEIREYDICLGTRMHGNMIGISEELPSIVITHDSRTEELASLMGVPRISAKSALDCGTISEIASKCNFDPVYFDHNRRIVSKIYVDAFKTLGLEPSKGLLSIAES